MEDIADGAARDLLVSMLREAAGLEQCLLAAYLYAACSIKSTPAEFADAERENRRRALQFERARRWKEVLLGVAVEEMRHLHLVECMLRALGEHPCFDFPRRNDKGVWYVPNWRIRMEGSEDKGVEVPVGPLNPETIRRFVLFEASDSLQDSGPFSNESEALYAELQSFELNLYIEGILLAIDDEPERVRARAELRRLYQELTPHEPVMKAELEAVTAGPPTIEDVRFASIADFYLRGILPLYRQAFERGWVKYGNRDLANELQESLPQESILPVGPVYRSNRYQRFTGAVDLNPLRHYKNISDVIHEIVDEGEGFSAFARRARKMLEAVSANGGASNYAQVLLSDRYDPNFQSPTWFTDAQQLRLSHLYRFIIVMRELDQESTLHHRAGSSFQAARAANAVNERTRLFTRELIEQTNACYLVMTAWLSRIYEVQGWAGDAPRRIAVEQLATWPLMSLALRPLLELASFFDVDTRLLFRIDSHALPTLPVDARQLLELFERTDRSEEINIRIDNAAVRTLTALADWADAACDHVDNMGLSKIDRNLILHRLRALKTIEDFEKQFPFREHGGYSGQMPDVPYQMEHAKEKSRYEEDPRTLQPLVDGAVLRLRFAGWGLVQLATDPDPPTDEAGAMGTLMLHAADGDKRFDRAILLQDFDPATTIRRGPPDAVPLIGVNCRDISLLLTPQGGASAGYSPIEPPPRFQRPGDVQPANGIQYDLAFSRATPLTGLGSVSAASLLGDQRKLRLFLRSKDGVRPYLVGNNHLTWQDGEPIDPFVIGLYADQAEGPPKALLEREVYNDAKTLLDMSPFQRIFTRREPCGFEFAIQTAVPTWAMSPDQVNQIVSNRGAVYLRARGAALGREIVRLLESSDRSQSTTDQIASFADRAFRVNIPRTTTRAWLTIGVHYGHTVSGDMTVNEIATLVSGFEKVFGVKITAAAAEKSGERSKAVNSRWLAHYTKGMMDVDALSDFCWGELYIPVVLSPGEGLSKIQRSWAFPRPLYDAVRALTCDFSKPFWSDQYVIETGRRTSRTKEGGTITESLHSSDAAGYEYNLDGLKDVTQASAAFKVDDSGDETRLNWTLAFSAGNGDSLVATLRMATGITDRITTALQTAFSIRRVLRPEIDSD